MVLPKDADGRQRHVRHLDEKLVPFKPEGLHPGNLVLLACFFCLLVGEVLNRHHPRWQ